MGGDLVDLSRCRDIHHVIRLHFDFVAGGQEGVEAHDQVWVAFKQLRHPTDHTWSVNAVQEREGKGEKKDWASTVGAGGCVQGFRTERCHD